MNRISHFEVQQRLFNDGYHLISNVSAYHGKQFLTEALATEFITLTHLREIKTACLDFTLKVKSLLKYNYIPADEASITAINAIDEALRSMSAENWEMVKYTANEVLLGFMPHFLSANKSKKLLSQDKIELERYIGVITSFCRRYCSDFL